MDLGQRIILLTSLGQLKHLRMWVDQLNYDIPDDIGLHVVHKEDGYFVTLMNLEENLYMRLSIFVNFLRRSGLINEPLLSIEADFDNNFFYKDHTIIFSLLLISNGQLVLTFVSSPDIYSEFETILFNEWNNRVHDLVL